MLGSIDRNKTTFFWAFWIKAKNRTTGVAEYGGLWTGAHEITLSIGGLSRVYLPGGRVVGLDSLTYTAGSKNIMSQTVEMNGVTPQVETLIRTFEARQADFEVHRLRPNNPLSLSGTWTSERAFSGRIDDIKFPRSAAGEDGSTDLRCVLTLMSASRMGTRTLALKKSDATQRMVDANDAGRKYSSSKAKVAWMTEVKNPHRADNNYNFIKNLFEG